MSDTVTLYGKHGTRVHVSAEAAEKLLQRGFRKSRPKGLSAPADPAIVDPDPNPDGTGNGDGDDDAA